MKAKEYAAKYRAGLEGDEPGKAATEMLIEFSKEMKVIATARNIQTDYSFCSLLKELNQKWNAVVNLLEKDGYLGVLRDGFMAVWKNRIPEINRYL